MLIGNERKRFVAPLESGRPGTAAQEALDLSEHGAWVGLSGFGKSALMIVICQRETLIYETESRL
jgi:hypothetical protein